MACYGEDRPARRPRAVKFEAKKFSAGPIRITAELLNDSAFDLTGSVAAEVQRRMLARAMAAYALPPELIGDPK